MTKKDAMINRKKYIKRTNQSVVAVQLALETDGFQYQKWGATQTCKPGDWIVNNQGETYTVDQESFALTYRPVGPGTYVKSAPVWAEAAAVAGVISTKEGNTHYQAGDYLVCNQEDGTDPYAVPASKFEEMYEPA
jgi:hypothetical protein